MKQNKEKTNSVQKALQILLAFSTHHPVWGVRELSTHLGFSPATVQRLLQNLKGYGFVDQDPVTRQYRLGNIYFNFLHTLQSTLPITRSALPFMKRLVSVTQETVHLNVIDGMERICVDTLESLQNLKAGMPIGSRSPLYAGASSKCLLAFAEDEFIASYLDQMHLIPITARTIIDKADLSRELAAIRNRGYASSLGERNPGLGSLSVPVLNHQGVLMAALSLAIPEIRFLDKEHCDFCRQNLISNARKLSQVMGHAG